MKLSQSHVWLPRGPAQDSKSRVQAADFRERLCESELHGGTAAERERESHEEEELLGLIKK